MDNLHDKLWDSFVRYSIVLLLKNEALRSKNPNDTVQQVVNNWRNIVNKHYNIQLGKLEEDDTTNILMKIMGMGHDDLAGTIQDNLNDMVGELIGLMRFEDDKTDDSDDV